MSFQAKDVVTVYLSKHLPDLEGTVSRVTSKFTFAVVFHPILLEMIEQKFRIGSKRIRAGYTTPEPRVVREETDDDKPIEGKDLRLLQKDVLVMTGREIGIIPGKLLKMTPTLLDVGVHHPTKGYGVQRHRYTEKKVFFDSEISYFDAESIECFEVLSTIVTDIGLYARIHGELDNYLVQDCRSRRSRLE